MLNNFVIVGRATGEVEEIENGKLIVIAVPRPFKNEEGQYETDFVPVKVWNGISIDMVKKGDIIGIKGRLQTNDKNIEAIAEKITFLSSKKGDEE